MSTPLYIKIYDVKPGDIIGFSGRHWKSWGVNLCSYGIPGWGLSHVGICSKVNEPVSGLRLFDSNYGIGVRYRDLKAAIRGYDGRAWLYRLSRPLYLHECARLTARATELAGRPYDSRGALRSGGRIWSSLQSLFRGEDLAALFCSEFVAELSSHIGLFNTSNASAWSPNHLMRTLRRLGIVQRPERLK
jgi:hypothetical protein